MHTIKRNKVRHQQILDDIRQKNSRGHLVFSLLCCLIWCMARTEGQGKELKKKKEI